MFDINGIKFILTNGLITHWDEVHWDVFNQKMSMFYNIQALISITVCRDWKRGNRSFRNQLAGCLYFFGAH